jgi:hypothetical protein
MVLSIARGWLLRGKDEEEVVAVEAITVSALYVRRCKAFLCHFSVTRAGCM